MMYFPAATSSSWWRIRRTANLRSGLTLLCLLPQLQAQISISKIGEYLVGDSAQPQNVSKPLNLRSHQDDALASFNGRQYCVYYSTIGSNTAQRFVTVGRRTLPAGTWETVILDDYIQTTNDSHNVIALGICEGDGSIHLAFDHHNEDLNYRVSVAGLATDPLAHDWVAGKFGAVQDNLPGLDKARTTGFTYPRFASTSAGDLQLVRRKGSAIAGKSMLYTYSPTSQLWQSHGVYLDGTLVLYHNAAGNDTKTNGYLNGLTYAGSRLHASWVWRTEGGTSANNFDFMYAYSDDHGISWRNNAGQLAGAVGNDPMTYANDPAVKVFDYPEGSGLANQTGQAVDTAGRLHVVQRKDGLFLHLYRDSDGTWVENPTSIAGGRYKITTDQNDNVYLITGSAVIHAATPGNNFTDWAVAYDADAGDFAGDAMFDEMRMKSEGILSILAARPGSSQEICSIDLSVSPVGLQPVAGDIFSEPDDASVREIPDVVSETSDATLLGTGGTSPWVDRCTVHVFRLPDLGPISNPFLSASYTFNYDYKQGTLSGNDLYGLRSSTSPEVLPADYYGQSPDPDPTDATRLQTDILTNSTPIGFVSSSGSGDAALRAFLNSHYAAGAGAGKYVFLRLNSTGPKSGINRASITTSEGGAATPLDTRPRISYTGSLARSALEAWRFSHFGSTANSGSAADTADPNGDGESNLLEFATGQDPHARTIAPVTIGRDGPTLTFTYTRSNAAVADGLVFRVEWSDSLSDGSWSSIGVTQEIDSDNGIIQSVTARLPEGSAGRRFVRLNVSHQD